MAEASDRPKVRHRAPAFAILAVAAVAALFFQIQGIVRQSLTNDEPYHLVAGYQALRYGRNTLNLEHPPLAKLVAALPALLLDKPLTPELNASEGSGQVVFSTPERARFLRLSGRGMMLFVFALPLLAAIYLLGKAGTDPTTGVVLALAIGLSFDILPYLSLVATDAAVALGFCLTLLGASRFLREPRIANAAAMGLGVGLAMAAKHSGLLAVVPVSLTILLAQGLSWRLRAGCLGVAGCVACLVLGGTYLAANLRYDRAVAADTIARNCSQRATLIGGQRMLSEEGALLATERAAPLLGQWLTGVLGVEAQNSIGVYAAHAFGNVRSRGRWWFFPALLMVRTPLVVLLASGCAAVEALRRWRDRARTPVRASPPAFRIVLLATASLYLATSMASNYNLGLRHLLPILPILYLPAAVWATRRGFGSALVAALLLESTILAPTWMSATNTWWLGSRNPTRFSLNMDDCDWKQNLLLLADSARRMGLSPLCVLDPRLSEAELHSAIPEAVLATPGVEPTRWCAVDVVVEQYFPAIQKAPPDTIFDARTYERLAETWDPLWKRVRSGEDRGYVAETFHLYEARR